MQHYNRPGAPVEVEGVDFWLDAGFSLAEGSAFAEEEVDGAAGFLVISFFMSIMQ